MNFKTAVPIGSGGMGEVFKAWDPSLERFVALKYLHSNDPVLVERLFREAKAQARLDHPSICKIYEVGENEGRHFIAMEFVDGQPLDVAAHHLSMEQKVLLLAQVADAIQAAHTAGLIHRDLKPANILVTDTDGELHPFILDFGIAQMEEAPSLTVTGQIVGTPGYLSPEQALGQVATLDRRSDIFSLGVILYEILSGTKPFEGASSIEVMINTLEGDPDMLRRRAPHVPRDLEAITMRCLEIEPEKRYPSARELADDLGRWLRGEPVLVRGVGPLYPLLRFVRRHKLATVLMAVFLIASIGGWLKYTIDLSRQQRLASAAREDAEGLVGFMLRDLFSRLKPLGRLDVLDEVAKETVAYYNRFGDEDLKPEQRLRRAQVLRNLADVEDAQGVFGEGLSSLRRAAAILDSGDNQSPEWQAERATTHSKISEFLQEQGDLEACLRELHLGLEIMQPLVDEHPHEAQWRKVLIKILINIAWAERERGQWANALAPLRQARMLADEPAEESSSSNDLTMQVVHLESYTAKVFQEAGDLESAEHHLEEAKRTLEELVEQNPLNMDYQFQRVLTAERWGSLAEDQERPKAAVDHYRRGLEQGLSLNRRDPANALWEREVSVIYSHLGGLLLAIGDTEGAKASFDSGLEISERLFSRGRPSATATNDLAWDWLQLGIVEEALGNAEQARGAYERTIALMAPIISEVREVWYLDTWAMALLRLGRVEEARPAVKELLDAGWDEEDFLDMVERHPGVINPPTE